jgi:hypothetical protein
LKYQGKPPLNYQYTQLKKNEEQEVKTGPFGGGMLVGGGHMERVKEGDCSGCILYSYMKIKQCNLLKLF